MTKQSRIHREVVRIEQIKKSMRRRDDKYITNLHVKGSAYYKEQYGNVIKILASSLFRRV